MTGTCTIVVHTSLRDCNHEAKDFDPPFEVEVPARPDGSPCLNALSHLMCGGKNDSGVQIVCAKGYWLGELVFYQQSLTRSIYPILPRRIETLMKKAAKAEQVPA